jgi:hypothetical protein
MNNESEYTLLDFVFSNGKKKLKVVLTYFKEIPKIDIREYYYNLTEDIFKPTPKGIQLDSSKAEALKASLESNTLIINKHLLSEDLDKWSNQIMLIKSSSDFFSEFEFYKTKSTAKGDEIIFNQNHPLGKKIIDLQSKVDKNHEEEELIRIINSILITYNQSLSQFDESAKTQVCDFLQDHNQTWGILLKRIFNPNK